MRDPKSQTLRQNLAQLRAVLGQSFPIIGVGGILNGADAVSKIEAGADLVQLYTGLFYRGPDLVSEAARALRRFRGAAVMLNSIPLLPRDRNPQVRNRFTVCKK